MTDETLMQATLLALTRQNVTGLEKGTSGAIFGDVIVYTEGWIADIPPIIGEVST